ncbi:hypothetical protein HOD75_04640 [archaeon]|jgi:hypothetical protein|nr:hypothetical protein [archaeon]MBT4242153.1 hypothetical protein [archaeon]MBT4417841.1 hypothetical protein [archaeon]
MITYLMGEIEERFRGKLAAVVHHDRDGGDYGTFLYPMDSEEMIQATGIQTTRNPIDRVYLGINREAGGRIIRASCTLNSLNNIPEALRAIDRSVVLAHFLRRN